MPPRHVGTRGLLEADEGQMRVEFRGIFRQFFFGFVGRVLPPADPVPVRVVRVHDALVLDRDG